MSIKWLVNTLNFKPWLPICRLGVRNWKAFCKSLFRQRKNRECDSNGLRTDVNKLCGDVDGLRVEVGSLRVGMGDLRKDIKLDMANLHLTLVKWQLAIGIGTIVTFLTVLYRSHLKQLS